VGTAHGSTAGAVGVAGPDTGPVTAARAGP
jgi:hypothetical protein